MVTHPKTMCRWEVVQQLAACLAERSGQTKGVVVSEFWQRLSICLWRGNASMLLHYKPHCKLGGWDLPDFLRKRW